MATKKSLPNSWQHSLATILKSLPEQPPRVAVLGIGSELRGDDAAGAAVARQLLEMQEHEGLPEAAAALLVCNGRHAPESQTGPIRRFKPHLVLMVDAAFVAAEPGAVRLLRWQETTGLSATTHTMPPYMLAQFLAADIGCEVVLLGIQPQALDLAAEMSLPVQRAVAEVVGGLQQLLMDNKTVSRTG